MAMESEVVTIGVRPSLSDLLPAAAANAAPMAGTFPHNVNHQEAMLRCHEDEDAEPLDVTSDAVKVRPSGFISSVHGLTGTRVNVVFVVQEARRWKEPATALEDGRVARLRRGAAPLPRSPVRPRQPDLAHSPSAGKFVVSFDGT